MERPGRKEINTSATRPSVRNRIMSEGGHRGSKRRDVPEVRNLVIGRSLGLRAHVLSTLPILSPLNLTPALEKSQRHEILTG